MKRTLLLLVVLVLGVAAAARGADPTPVPPTATTGSASAVTTTAATVAGTATSGGAGATAQFEYGTSTAYGLTTPPQALTADAGDQAVSASLSGLTSATTYHYRLVAAGPAGTAQGADRTFTTAASASAPRVSTGTPRATGQTSGTLNASVNPGGLATQVAFQYGTGTAYGATSASVDAGAGRSTRGVSVPITGLRANTVYHLRAVATNAAGVARGGDRSFRTSALPRTLALTSAAPSPLTFGATATLQGQVGGSTLSGVTVSVQRRSFPYTAEFFATGQTAKTDSRGRVSFGVGRFDASTQFRLVTGAVVTDPATVLVRPLVSFGVQRRSGGRVRLHGAVNPGSATGTVSIQRRTPAGRWVFYRRTPLIDGRGPARYSVVVTLHRSRLLLRARVAPGDGGRVTGLSGSRVVLRRAPRG